MPDDAFKALDDAFAVVDAKQAAFLEEQKRKKEIQFQNKTAFREIRDQKLRPVFERFAAYLKGKGWSTEILSDGDNPVGRAPSGDAFIEFRFSPQGFNGLKMWPGLKIRTDGNSEVMHLSESTFLSREGGTYSPSGTIKFGVLTPAMIEQKLSDIILQVIQRR